MSDTIVVTNPASEEAVAEVRRLPLADLIEAAGQARRAQGRWADTPLAERLGLVERFCTEFESRLERIAGEVTAQMGKPRGQAEGEVRATLFRARSLIEQAEAALAPRRPADIAGYERYVERLPHGVVLNMAAWNYPLLIAVNVIVPAVIAGNAVLVKHSARTPLSGSIFEECFLAAGAEPGLVRAVQASHGVMAEFIGSGHVDYVAFTGSVEGGRQVQQAARSRFIGVGLELGGKDAAYVTDEQDDLSWVAANLAEGFTYNCGQSCCAIERIYVHHKVYDRFLEGFVESAREWQPGDPAVAATNLGPLASESGREHIVRQAEDARQRGASVLLEGGPTAVNGRGFFYRPQVFADVTGDMKLMREENFGPIVGVVRVRDDDEAIRLMNDSAFGLTGSIWSRDGERARGLVSRVSAGTVFLNRADYLDPTLPWTGYRDSGIGSTLGHEGFWNLTRPRAIHVRLEQG